MKNFARNIALVISVIISNVCWLSADRRAEKWRETTLQWQTNSAQWQCTSDRWRSVALGNATNDSRDSGTLFICTNRAQLHDAVRALSAQVFQHWPRLGMNLDFVIDAEEQGWGEPLRSYMTRQYFFHGPLTNAPADTNRITRTSRPGETAL